MSNQFKIIKYAPALVPPDPGVYIFRRAHTILYIGKASNLRKRVSSYFRRNVSDKVAQLRGEATSLECISLSSEIEALLKEAELIKRHVPKFNVLMRDDKNYAYVAITDKTFPNIFVTHQLEDPVRIKMGSGDSKKNKINVTYIGPYTSSVSLKITLKLLRKLFPYCTCTSAHKRKCLNAEIGLCPGYCCLLSPSFKNIPLLQKEYHTHINAIASVLTGKRQHLVKELKTAMRKATQAQEFEQAARLRDQIMGIEDVMCHRFHLMETGTKKKNYRKNWNSVEKNITMALGTPAPISRVEGYDISHVSGVSTTASMVVFVDGVPSRDDYRMFKIKTVPGISDVDALKEVIERRLNHTEWQYPDLMVIDGGKPQLNAVMSVIAIRAPQLTNRIVSLAKREEELYLPKHAHTIRLDSLPPETGFFFQRIRDESHRFAKRYHHKLREISYRPVARI